MTLCQRSLDLWCSLYTIFKHLSTFMNTEPMPILVLFHEIIGALSSFGEKFASSMIAIKPFLKISFHTFQIMHRLPVSWCRIGLIIVCQKFNKMQSWKDTDTEPKSIKDLVKKILVFLLLQFGYRCNQCSLYYHIQKHQ